MLRLNSLDPNVCLWRVSNHETTITASSECDLKMAQLRLIKDLPLRERALIHLIIEPNRTDCLRLDEQQWLEESKIIRTTGNGYMEINSKLLDDLIKTFSSNMIFEMIDVAHSSGMNTRIKQSRAYALQELKEASAIKLRDMLNDYISKIK